MFKVVLLGEGIDSVIPCDDLGRVGKTSLLKRIMKKKFTDSEISTTQASHCQKTFYIENQSITLDIWDTAGQEQYHALGPVYYRDADAAILVFDVSMEDTFEMVKSWVKEITSICEKDIVYVIAGNKIDLNPSADIQEAEQFARSIQGECITTSAKTGSNLDLLFITVAKALLRKRVLPNQDNMYSLNSALINAGDVEGLPNNSSTKKCCC